MDKLMCKCGCNQEAKWLMTFGGAEPAVDEPACDSAAAYCGECCHEFGLKFSKKEA